MRLRRPGVTRQFARVYHGRPRGIGGIAVGWFTENENLIFHSLGALAYFVLPNVGLVVLGRSAAGAAARARL